MLQKDKNKLLGLIKGTGLDPKIFKAETVSFEHNAEGFKIGLVGSEMEFFVKASFDSYSELKSKYSKMASEFPLTPWFPRNGYGDFEEVTEHLANWLNDHVGLWLEDKNEPDLWAEALGQSKLDDYEIPEQVEETFSEEERLQVRVSLSNVRVLIQEEFKPSEAQMKVVDQRLEYLGAALDRLNKFDWRGVLLSTIIGIATNLSLDTTSGAALKDLFKTAFSGVAHLLQ